MISLRSQTVPTLLMSCLLLIAGSSRQSAFGFGVPFDHDGDWTITGNLGIGTLSTSDEIHILSPSPQIRFDDNLGALQAWQIYADSDHFDIIDLTGGDLVPFRIAPDATSTLFIGGSSIGINTLNPTGTLNVADNLNPSLRFTETGVMGDAENNVWEIFAGANGLQTFDVLSSTVPFSIEFATPTDTLRLKADGSIGVGTNAPAYPFHVVRTTGTANRIAQFTQNKANGTSVVGFENSAAASTANQTGFDFALQTSTTQRVAGRMICSFIDTNDATRTGVFQFRVTNEGAFTETMRLRGNRVGIGQSNPSTTLQVVNATCDGATWNNACSRELKQDIVTLDGDAARSAVMALAPVTYSYKAQPADQRVGFVAEDVPGLVAMPDGKTLSSLDIVAALTKVVQDHEALLASRNDELSQLKQTLAEQSRIAAQQAAASRAQIELLRERLEALERTE
ncbi:MAG: tail fiber domain-containing protein [Planctomycetaceae bacterium]